MATGVFALEGLWGCLRPRARILQASTHILICFWRQGMRIATEVEHGCQHGQFGQRARFGQIIVVLVLVFLFFNIAGLA